MSNSVKVKSRIRGRELAALKRLGIEHWLTLEPTKTLFDRPRLEIYNSNGHSLRDILDALGDLPTIVKFKVSTYGSAEVALNDMHIYFVSN